MRSSSRQLLQENLIPSILSALAYQALYMPMAFHNQAQLPKAEQGMSVGTYNYWVGFWERNGRERMRHALTWNKMNPGPVLPIHSPRNLS